MDYVDDVVGICPNQAHVNPWKAIRLVPCSSTILLVEACDDETDWEAVGFNNNQLAFKLQVGDNFAIPIKPRNAKYLVFFVLNCVKCLYKETNH